MAKSYLDLEVYREAYGLALEVHQVTLTLPQFELYEEGSQARRAAKGVASCIVEGFCRNKYKSDFIKYLVYAHASCNETICHLNFIKDLHAATVKKTGSLIKKYDMLGRKLNKFITFVEESWRTETTGKKQTR